MHIFASPDKSSSQNYTLFTAIQSGAEFFLSEEDYVDSKLDYSSRSNKSKHRTPRGSISHTQVSVVIGRTASTLVPADSGTAGKKRPRRSAAENRSYLIPDSDSEAEIMEVDLPEEKANLTLVHHLELWIKHLGDLQKSEQANVSFHLDLVAQDCDSSKHLLSYENEKRKITPTLM